MQSTGAGSQAALPKDVSEAYPKSFPERAVVHFRPDAGLHTGRLQINGKLHGIRLVISK